MNRKPIEISAYETTLLIYGINLQIDELINDINDPNEPDRWKEVAHKQIKKLENLRRRLYELQEKAK